MRYKAAGMGVLLTTILFLLPFPYAYAPVIGGLFAALVAHSKSLSGVQVSVLVGLGMIPASVAIAALVNLTPSVFSNSGAANLIYALRGSGPQNLIFYGVFVYFIAVYSGLCTTLFAGMRSLIANQIRNL